MAKFEVPKTITFENLGEKFKDSSLTFRAIPVADIAEIDKVNSQLNDSGENAVQLLDDILSKYFIKGTFYDMESDKNLDVAGSDLPLLPSDVLFACFQALTGVPSDPKDAS